MRISGRWLRRQISGCLMVVLLTLFMAAAALPQQATSSRNDGDRAASAPTQAKEPQSDDKKGDSSKVAQAEALPDSPGSVRLQTIAENRVSTGQEPQQSSPQQSSPPPAQQNSAQEPVGTAAAGSVKTTGVAASQPAGAAIAPAKQRRTRSILIKVGALVGAGVPVGAVVGLSSAIPSHPR